MSINVFFSNRTEQLYDCFKEQLFASSHPFTKRIVIVPSAAMKTWLQLKMAEDPNLKVAAGIEVNFIDPSFKRLSSILSLKTESHQQSYEPNRLELGLALETAIKELIVSFESCSFNDQTLLQPLLSYSGVNGSKGNPIPRRSQNRITALSMQLAKVFESYGCFGQAILSDWHKENPKHWQQLLWHKMEVIFSTWDYPCRKLEDFELSEVWESEDVQIHLFGLSYIAPLHHRFFQKVATRLPVQYYLLSPCQQFWSDILSQKESLYLKSFWQRQGVQTSQQEALDEFLRDNNPLLANFGRLGREMALQIENSEALVHERYVIPNSLASHPIYKEIISTDSIVHHEQKPLTLLNAIQADMLLLRNPLSNDKIAFNSYDETIQVHGAPKPSREVQVIYDLILSIIDKHACDEDPILPGDIIVMAPDINTYAPFIRAVFESQESQMDVHIMDLKAPGQHPLIQSFLELLKLPQGRWEISRLSHLLECSAFRAKCQFSTADVRLIFEWLNEAGVCWGATAQHRNELLKRDHDIEGMVEECWHGTWEHGLGRLLESLAIQLKDGNQTWSPLGAVDASQAELLGSFLSVLRSLLADLQPLIDGTELPLKDWSEYLKCLFDSYFDWGGEDKGSLLFLMGQIEAFSSANSKQKKTKFSFRTILKHFEQGLQSQSCSHKEFNLQAVRFCSLLPMRAVPAKVIVMMGMDDGKFPRSEDSHSMNMLHDNPKADYLPTQTEFDRYLFLESLLSSRYYFIMTYSSQVAGDPHPQSPSLLVKELMTYLDSAFILPEGSSKEYCLFDHPLKPFHKKYFIQKSAFKSYSKQWYQAALTHYNQRKEPHINFLSAFTPLKATLTDLPEKTINLSDLIAFVKNPFKMYFNKALNIFFDKEQKGQGNDSEDLLVTQFNRSTLVKEALLANPHEVFSAAEMSGRLPRGPFKSMELMRLTSDVNTLKDNLDQHAIDPKEIFTLELSEHFHREDGIVKNGSHWQLPSLKISDEAIGTLTIVGKIEMVSLQGLVVFNENTFEEAIKIWPTLLVLCCLIDEYAMSISKQAIFIKGKKVGCQTLDFASPHTMLVDFLKYYMRSLNQLSPLHPTWVSHILHADKESLQKEFQSDDENAFRPIYDEYLKWMVKSSPHINVEDSIKNWQPTAQSLFVAMNDAWFPKRASKGVHDEIV